MKATLLGVPISHPSLSAELMLRHKAIEYRRIDLVSTVHRLMVRALGFPAGTVPVLLIAGARIQGSGRIALALDALRPEPRLFPADPGLRRRVEEADAWGDEVYQPLPRRIMPAAFRRDRSTLATYLEGARLGIPVPLATRIAPPLIRAAARLNRSSEAAVRADLAALPGLLDRVDGLLAEGVIGGQQPNAADFQIATTTALLLTMEDLRPLIEGRPAAGHARRIAPGYPGHLPKALPPAWLQR